MRLKELNQGGWISNWIKALITWNLALKSIKEQGYRNKMTWTWKIRSKVTIEQS